LIPIFKSRLKSFGYALGGMRAFFVTEANGRIHLAAAILVTAAGWYFEITLTEWCIQWLCIAMVIALEMINSAIEKSIDLYVSNIHPKAKYIKDVSAAAVLMAAVISVIVAAIIYIPKIGLF
jgi:diacylglycerol kinase